MGVSWTAEQQQVIDLRNRNILVSAAAGSGKTAVLVERIIKMITDKEHPVDIDRLLIVTFTNAAAAEMRERIGDAIEKVLDANPGDEHLLRQLTLIHNAQITTIDSFCLYVIRNHFHEIDLEPNFRIGDEGELKLLKEDVLRRLLEDNYETPTEVFSTFVEGYASGRTDAALGDMILQLYEFSRSYPWPGKWLDACIGTYHVENTEEMNHAQWMIPLIQNIQFVLNDTVALMEQALTIALSDDGPNIYEKAVRSDLEKYKAIAMLDHFDELYQAIGQLTYDRLASSKGFEGDPDKLEQVKQMRDQAKDVVKKITKQYFFCSPEMMVEQLNRTEPMVNELVRLTKSFADKFAEEKKKKNLVDFHDLEHFALQILVDEETEKPKKTAEEFRDTFEEIMIDEYQDSNQVQETLLRAISREERNQNNIFMVGDVKQSIYRFRLARPELFMKKYDDYSLEESVTQRIDLHKNFRSRNEVLECTNDIFYRIMARNLGNVEYDAEAALYPGASYPASSNFAPELWLVDSNDDLLEDSEYSDKKLLEAKMAAVKIKKMMKEQLVTDKKTGELRSLHFSDIVILLRSLSGWADRFVEVLNEEGIPAHTISATGYFSAIEVQTILSMLRILDNPRQDIPLAAVLRSPIVGLSDEQLGELRLYDSKTQFHNAVLELAEELLSREAATEAEKKLAQFYKEYKRLRLLVPDTPIHELIEIILRETGYDSYVAAMPAGNRRQANLNMLLEKAIAYENTSYKGLFHFVRYIDELQKYDVDFGEADMVGENEDVIRIMSIHKSKGLEFPVVIVAGLGKNFNKQDVRSKMVLHPELGIGLDYMDGIRRVKSPTIAKKAIAKKTDLENLGEELRVLYVALTRAKEKLILSGSLKDAPEKVAQLGQQSRLNTDSKVLPYLMREGAATYLDWVLPAMLSYGEKYQIEVTEVADLVMEEVAGQVEQLMVKEERIRQIVSADEAKVEDIKERFAQKYPYQTDILRKNKYSVSELKHRAMREKFEQEQEETIPLFLEEIITPTVPKFMQRVPAEYDSNVSQGALRGTAVHRVMECYHFSDDKEPKEQILEMEESGKLTADMKKLVKLSIVEAFVQSETGKRMARAEAAGKLFREKPFVMGFEEAELESIGLGLDSSDKLEKSGVKTDVSDINEENANEENINEEKFNSDLTLIQGIIDVFWIEEDGIVLLDYKTDRVDTAEELIDRYESQLKLYAIALERVFSSQNLKVKEILIYSFRLEEVIAL